MADAAVTVDRPAPRDAPDVLMARDVVDAGCAVGESEPCACPGTLGERRCAADGWSACRCPSLDAGAPPDAGEAPDVAVAVPDVVDAPPVDAGPQVYPLDPPPGGLEVRVLFFETCTGQDGGPCGVEPITAVTGATCTRTGSRLNFNLRAGSQITGLVPDYRSNAGASVAVVGGGATQGRNIEVMAGAEVGGRQSFRVSFSAPPTPSVAGVTGVPGRTVSPDRGDVWLLGCEVR
jgi:hypothetical protein